MKKKFRLDSCMCFGGWSWFILLTLILFACNQQTKQIDGGQAEMMETKKEIYYCPMHPEIQQDHPGTCPKPECKGMPLVKKLSENILNAVLQPVNSSILSTIKTIHPQEKEMPISFDAQGFVDYDNRTKRDIASKYNGRIENLYIKYNYQYIAKGDVIFDIYSPDLNTAQENLLYLLNTDSKDKELIDAAKEKIKLLGFSDMQIDDLVQSKKVSSTIPVISKWDGHIHEMLDAESNNVSSEKMNANTSLQSTQELSVKEGMYVTRGQTIFNVVDPHQIVAMLQIRSEDIAKIKLNQVVELVLDVSPQLILKGKVNFIEPFLNPGSKTLLARVDINNDGHKFRVGTLFKAIIKDDAVEGLWVPAKSVIDLGTEKMVWLKKDGHFVAHKIEVGAMTKDWVEIYDGITKEDEIAIEAHYLSDSESFVKISDDN
jgi:Cu(I)/Ag(I) efflux system membrane fusion protein